MTEYERIDHHIACAFAALIVSAFGIVVTAAVWPLGMLMVAGAIVRFCYDWHAIGNRPGKDR